MKHALIITAYKDIEFLKELCEVYSKHFNIYVHFDKKIYGNAIEVFNRINNVTAISEYIINWGSINHVLAIIELLKLACEDGNQYVHVISGNSILCKNPNKLFAFFEKNPDKIFMEVKENDGHSFYEFEYRYKSYFFQHKYNLRGSAGFILRRLEKGFAFIQRKLKLRDNISFKWKGYVYCHMPINAVRYVLQYICDHPEYLNALKYCYVGEEFFFQNIIMNSIYRTNVINETLIYDIWSQERGYPAELNIGDIDNIIVSNPFFARKVSDTNKSLWDEIREREKF